MKLQLSQARLDTMRAAIDFYSQSLNDFLNDEAIRPTPKRAPVELIALWHSRRETCDEILRDLAGLATDAKIDAAFADGSLPPRERAPFHLAFHDGSGFLPRSSDSDEPAVFATLQEAVTARDAMREDWPFPLQIVPAAATSPPAPAVVEKPKRRRKAAQDNLAYDGT